MSVTSGLTRLYPRLPRPARVLAAAARGLYLRSWRYGAETPGLIAEAHDREHWPPERWRRWQEDRLAFLLHRAATRVPHYRELWAARRLRGDRSSWERLENWPVLPKSVVRQSPERFLADDCDRRRMFRDRTSGTTGTPLSIYASRETVRRHYALFEARVREWHGVSWRDRWAMLGGQLVVPANREHPPFWVSNPALNQIYLSSYHLSAATAPAYAKLFERARPTHLVAYPSSAAVLAGRFLDQGLRVPPLRVVFSNAEELTETQRQMVGRAFGCPLRNTYGMAEGVAAASECSEGTLHLWPEQGILETLADAEEGATVEAGRLVATGLNNPDYPLIRYETGDRGRLGGAGPPCACGRDLPRLLALEGRSQDLVVTPDGRKIFWLNPVFYDLPISEGQIVQEALDRVRIRVAGSERFGAGDEAELLRRVAERLGPGIRLEIERVAHLPRTPAGKLRPIVSEIPSGSRP